MGKRFRDKNFFLMADGLWLIASIPNEKSELRATSYALTPGRPRTGINRQLCLTGETPVPPLTA